MIFHGTIINNAIHFYLWFSIRVYMVPVVIMRFVWVHASIIAN